MLARSLSEAGMVLRLARDFRSFVASPLTGAQAADAVRRELAARNERFLGMLEGSIFGHPRSPYRWLLKAAGCEPGDARALVKAEGLEGALRRLCETGVYVTFDEFKGRAAHRQGESAPGRVRARHRPTGRRRPLETRTGGSRGAGTALKIDLTYIAERAAQSALAFETHGLQQHDKALWWSLDSATSSSTRRPGTCLSPGSILLRRSRGARASRRIYGVGRMNQWTLPSRCSSTSGVFGPHAHGLRIASTEADASA